MNSNKTNRSNWMTRLMAELDDNGALNFTSIVPTLNMPAVSRDSSIGKWISRILLVTA